MARKLNFRPGRHEDIDRALQSEVGDNVHIRLKPGTYHWTEGVSKNGLRNFKLLGSGEGSTTIKTGSGPSNRVELRGVGDVEVGDFTIDWGDQWDRAGMAFTMVGSSPTLRDVTWKGSTPREDIARNHKAKVMVSDADGTGEIARLTSTGPSHIGGHRDGRGMGVISDNNAGALHIHDCHVENEPGDGTWYTSGLGKLIYENNYFKNNAMAQIRTGGKAEVRNNVLVVDYDDAHPDNRGTYHAANALYLAGQLGDYLGAEVENNDIIIRSTPPQASGAAGLRTHQTVGDATFRNTRWKIDDGVVHTEQYYGSYPRRPSDPSLHFKNCSFTGSTGASAAINIEDRPGSTASSCCFDMPNVGSFTSNPNDLDVSGLRTAACTPARERDPTGGGSTVSMPSPTEAVSGMGSGQRKALVGAAALAAGYYLAKEGALEGLDPTA